jgi:hypothetical protein
MITVRDAMRIAKEWVEAEAPNIPNFQGAFLNGSILWKNDDEPQPETSDVDVKILVDLDDPKLLSEQGLKQKYKSYKGILLDTTFSLFQEFSTPEQILANYHYGANFTFPNILSDPSGALSKIQKVVASKYEQRKWVTKRVEGARDYVLSGLDSLKSGSYVDRLLSLFVTSLHIALIPILADLRPPTIRKSGIVFLQIMKNIGRLDLHESLLNFYGSQSFDRADVERHLEDLTNTFDRSLEIVQSPSLSDYINPLARSLVISASQEMINQGFHCEAMFWIFCMRAVCQDTILRDAPDEEQMYYSKKYDKLLAELGLRSEDDFQKRAEDGALLLDEVMQIAEHMVETNPKITP